MDKFKLLAVSLAVLAVPSAFSATPVDLRNQPVSLLQSFSNPALKATDVTFEPAASYVDFNQTRHVRMKQKYKGYPVWGGDAVVHTPDAGRANKNLVSARSQQPHMNGLIYQGLAADLGSPAQFNDAQKEKALNYVINYYKSKAKKPGTISRAKAELMVYVDADNKAHWAYYAGFFTQPEHGMPVKPVYIIDALSSQIYKSWNNLQTDDREEVSGGGYGGNRKIGKIIYDGWPGDAPALRVLRDPVVGSCYLQRHNLSIRDLTNNNMVVQYECKEPNPKRRDTYWNETSYYDTTGAYSPDNDAFVHAYIVQQMYEYLYHTPVWMDEFGESAPIEINTHLSDSNAMFDDDTKEFYFGDGDDTKFLPFTSIDIVAHELSHGFTYQNSGLIYSDQSGGLNEAFSDMAGATAEYLVKGKTSWKNGGDITLTRDALRYYDNPRRDCVGVKPNMMIMGKKVWGCSIDHMKDYQDGSIEVGEGFSLPLVDVHYSSGIFNKAFYLMAQGWGGDANAGTRKAFDVMLQANKGYWTPRTTFAEAACGVMEATYDYGYDQSVVTKAFAAVGIDTSKC